MTKRKALAIGHKAVSILYDGKKGRPKWWKPVYIITLIGDGELTTLTKFEKRSEARQYAKWVASTIASILMREDFKSR